MCAIGGSCLSREQDKQHLSQKGFSLPLSFPPLLLGPRQGAKEVFIHPPPNSQCLLEEEQNLVEERALDSAS